MDGLFRHARLPQGAVLLELIVASVAATAVADRVDFLLARYSPEYRGHGSIRGQFGQ